MGAHREVYRSADRGPRSWMRVWVGWGRKVERKVRKETARGKQGRREASSAVVSQTVKQIGRAHV